MKLELYRGDTIYNKYTQPGKYRSEGLRSKSFMGDSDPAYISKIGLLEAIRIHIKPIGDSEKNRYDHTGFLSFSSDRSLALDWAEGKEHKGLLPCAFDFTETRYLFKMIIPEIELVTLSEAVYLYKFKCNVQLKGSNSPGIEQLLTTHYKTEICPLCNGIYPKHSILLINTVKFLAHHKSLATYKGAYANAERDGEWLVFPNDPLGPINSARIPRADFWFAEHFIVPSEITRDPMYCAILGTIT